MLSLTRLRNCKSLTAFECRMQNCGERTARKKFVPAPLGFSEMNIRSRVFRDLSFLFFSAEGYEVVTGKSVDYISNVILNANPNIVILSFAKNLRSFSANFKVVLLIFIWISLPSSTPLEPLGLFLWLRRAPKETKCPSFLGGKRECNSFRYALTKSSAFQ